MGIESAIKTTLRGLGALLAAVPRTIAVFVWGPPGVGKTEKIGQASRDAGETRCEICILGQRPPEDILGLPDVDRAAGTSRYAAFPWLRRLAYDVEKEKPEPLLATLFFDEFNAARPAVMLAAQRLVLERRVDDLALRPGVRVVVAGNRTSDGCMASSLPFSARNRFLHVEVEPDPNEWMEDYAIPRGIDHSIRSHLRAKPANFYTFDPARDAQAFASPRTWSLTSDFLVAAEAAGATDGTIELGVAGLVGAGVATEFLAHRKLENKVPTPDEIAANPDGCRLSENAAQSWYVFGWLAADLGRNPDPQRAEAFLTYAFREPRVDLQVAFLRDALLGGDKARDVVRKSKAFIHRGWPLVRDITIPGKAGSK